MSLLCKIFGHRWKYYLTVVGACGNYRVCTRCYRLEQWMNLPVYGVAWFRMIERTKKGAAEWLLSLEDTP